MHESKKIRLVSESDTKAILEIYKPFIKNTVITFEYEIPTIAAFSERIKSIQKKYPYLVCEIDGSIVGYAYASEYNTRAAFDWSVELSIYINPKYHRKNIATALYSCLLKLLKLQGFYNAYALITSPNPQSEGFHTAFGFKPISFYPEIGYKFGIWHSLKCYELTINDHSEKPKTPKSIDQIKDTQKFNAILSKAENIITSFN